MFYAWLGVCIGYMDISGFAPCVPVPVRLNAEAPGSQKIPIWMFPKILVKTPQIIPFVHRIFHYLLNHPFFWVALFLETFIYFITGLLSTTIHLNLLPGKPPSFSKVYGILRKSRLWCISYDMQIRYCTSLNTFVAPAMRNQLNTWCEQSKFLAMPRQRSFHREDEKGMRTEWFALQIFPAIYTKQTLGNRPLVQNYSK